MFGIGECIRISLEIDSASYSLGGRISGKITILNNKPAKIGHLMVHLRAMNPRLSQEFDVISVHVAEGKPIPANDVEQFYLDIPPQIVYDNAPVVVRNYEWKVCADLDCGMFSKSEDCKPIALMPAPEGLQYGQ